MNQDSMVNTRVCSKFSFIYNLDWCRIFLYSKYMYGILLVWKCHKYQHQVLKLFHWLSHTTTPVQGTTFFTPVSNVPSVQVFPRDTGRKVELVLIFSRPVRHSFSPAASQPSPPPPSSPPPGCPPPPPGRASSSLSDSSRLAAVATADEAPPCCKLPFSTESEIGSWFKTHFYNTA